MRCWQRETAERVGQMASIGELTVDRFDARVDPRSVPSCRCTSISGASIADLKRIAS